MFAMIPADGSPPLFTPFIPVPELEPWVMSIVSAVIMCTAFGFVVMVHRSSDHHRRGLAWLAMLTAVAAVSALSLPSLAP